jgi:TolA-binding protein
MAAMIRFGLPALALIQVLSAAEPGKLTDAQVEALAREALQATDPQAQTEALKRLQIHHFKSSLAKEREVALYAEGMLQDRLGQPSKAAATFHRLEQTWPRSPFLPEAQVIMAEAALEHKRPKEAELRLRKALAAELPAESVRRSQELLLWCLADQGKAAEGLAIADSLKPLGSVKPSEKGLVGLFETLCSAKRRQEAMSVQADYHKLYPSGPRGLRVDLGWAKLLGTLGEAGPSAQAFQKVIQGGPNTPEADEARLALATLLTDGRLTPKESQGLPAAASLLADLNRATLKDGPTRQTFLVKLRLGVKDRQWRDAIDTAGHLRSLHPTEPEALQVANLRAEALRGWTQDLLDKQQAAPLLPYLDGEGIRCLTPVQRLALVKRLAATGLPEAAHAVLDAAPAAERPPLRRAALDAAGASNPQGTLALLAPGPETPQESLQRAQANAALGAWPAVRAALAKAKPGPDRIQTLMALLSRPADPKEGPRDRLKEAQGWLARAPEKGADREPLAILTADLHTRQGDWKGALALYPAAPQPVNRAWVALMRATCLARLGQKAPAQAALKQAAGDPAYKAEREGLERTLAK